MINSIFVVCGVGKSLLSTYGPTVFHSIYTQDYYNIFRRLSNASFFQLYMKGINTWIHNHDIHNRSILTHQSRALRFIKFYVVVILQNTYNRAATKHCWGMGNPVVLWQVSLVYATLCQFLSAILSNEQLLFISEHLHFWVYLNIYSFWSWGHLWGVVNVNFLILPGYALSITLK